MFLTKKQSNNTSYKKVFDLGKEKKSGRSVAEWKSLLEVLGQSFGCEEVNRIFRLIREHFRPLPDLGRQCVLDPTLAPLQNDLVDERLKEKQMFRKKSTKKGIDSIIKDLTNVQLPYAA